eukprot:CAMPEP_0171160198 /NCGR_PEP_ID=MMETSP0790-20130122/3431_1 /TAXON_ID=2925 /ORGANISM="Alexandrium catenella, Strain OF101" /LENGTH=364 /DNA_ID=CAMNT_0011624719 /DNA_START=12 /DNA_END=1106 /DNA_ORIENTATION=-
MAYSIRTSRSQVSPGNLRLARLHVHLIHRDIPTPIGVQERPHPADIAWISRRPAAKAKFGEVDVALSVGVEGLLPSFLDASVLPLDVVLELSEDNHFAVVADVRRIQGQLQSIRSSCEDDTGQADLVRKPPVGVCPSNLTSNAVGVRGLDMDKMEVFAFDPVTTKRSSLAGLHGLGNKANRVSVWTLKDRVARWPCNMIILKPAKSQVCSLTSSTNAMPPIDAEPHCAEVNDAWCLPSAEALDPPVGPDHERDKLVRTVPRHGRKAKRPLWPQALGQLRDARCRKLRLIFERLVALRASAGNVASAEDHVASRQASARNPATNFLEASATRRSQLLPFGTANVHIDVESGDVVAQAVQVLGGVL